MNDDRFFKELLRVFFGDFIKLFLPDVARYVVFTSFEFLDKEIFTDIQSSERHVVDLVVKVRFRGRGQGFFLIHVENQATARKHFARRMFRYFARLLEKYGLPVFPVAIFSYDRPRRAEPDHYQIDFPDFRVLDFTFRAIQLNRLNWRDFVDKPSPVASALMSKMQIATKDRPRVKLKCAHMLATLKLDKARATMIGTFMDNYLKLSAAENRVYNREVDKIEPREREVVMQLTNSWIERGRIKGRKEGLRKGLEKGLQEGRREVALRLLRRKFGDLPAKFAGQVAILSKTDLGDLTDALLDFATLKDARRWLAERARP